MSKALEAALPEQDVTIARLLRDPDAEYWQVGAPSSWQMVLTRLFAWVNAVAPDLSAPLPGEFKQIVSGSVEYPTGYGPFRASLLGLVAWLSEGSGLVPAAAMRAQLERTRTIPDPLQRADQWAAGHHGARSPAQP